MAKKAKKATYASINEKYANSKLKKIDSLMDELRVLIGKKGDAAAKKTNTLIGAVEAVNDQAYDGAKLTAAYTRFNNTTLPTFKNQVYAMDFEFNVIDKLAK